jgi:hypothetical protein
MRDNQRGIWIDVIRDVPSLFGISRSCVIKNTFSSDPLKLTYSEFIKRLRNALSHPTYPEKSPNLPSTGYTTVADESRLISHFRFVDSPWVSRGEILGDYALDKQA